MADNLNNNSRANFDRNADVNLSAEQLSYICKYCGKVNPMSAPNCIRCGKRRPRNEYLTAMKRLDESTNTRQAFISEQARLEAQAGELRAQEIDRLVESRVEDEKAQIVARQAVILDQDREEIKRATARDAVLRIIAAENAADTKVAEAEDRAERLIRGKNAEIDDLIAEEREKALNAAAERLVAERAAIEEVAKERVEANQRATELDAARQIAMAQDEAEKNAARHAVLQVIAYQNAADEQIRLSRNAFQQAATERIIEERILADKEAAARYAAEKQAIEQAAEERIRAERERIRRLLGERGGMIMDDCYGGPQQVQPFAIVPYLNPNQPVMQYDPDRVVYRFVPDDPSQMPKLPTANSTVEKIAAPTEQTKPAAPEKEGKKVRSATKKARVCGLLTALSTLIVIAIIVLIELISDGFTKLNITDGGIYFKGGNLTVLLSAVAFIVGVDKLPESFAENLFYLGAQRSETILNYATVIADLTVVLTVIAFAMFIVGLVRLFSGKASKADWIGGFLMLLVSVAIGVVYVLAAKQILEDEFMNMVKKALFTNYGVVALVVLSLLTTIFAGVGGSKKKDKEVKA